MAQPSIATYFNVKKRSALDEAQAQSIRKVFVVDKGCDGIASKKTIYENHEKAVVKPSKTANVTATISGNRRIVKLSRKKESEKTKAHQNVGVMLEKLIQSDKETNTAETRDIIHRTPPSTPTKTNEVKDLQQLKSKLLRSNRLTELKKSIDRFKQLDEKLQKVEETNAQLKQSPTLKTFKDVEFEVSLSPKKVTSPEKPYLSPKKDLSPRKNLTSLFGSSNSNSLKTLEKSSLTLPYHYRTIAEFFRAIETVSQLMFNRNEEITFRKVQKAVEKMLKRNLSEKHLGQIKTLLPHAYTFEQKSLRVFGEGVKKERWELILKPNCTNLTADLLLKRRRELFNILLEKVKDYHCEFLQTLDPPLNIPREKIARWHPEFDIEKIPDIPVAELPQAPTEEALTTGQQVLEKARTLFGSNTRMERALDRLREKQQEREENPPQVETKPTSLLKGIPQFLLDKVREKQAAKALEMMTRSKDKEKEVQLYSRLPEIARLTRNLFVTEKKSVLPLDIVIDKLMNSYRVYLSKPDMINVLNTLIKEIPLWLTLHDIRNVKFLKMVKNMELNLITQQLDTLFKQKQG